MERYGIFFMLIVSLLGFGQVSCQGPGSVQPKIDRVNQLHSQINRTLVAEEVNPSRNRDETALRLEREKQWSALKAQEARWRLSIEKFARMRGAIEFVEMIMRKRNPTGARKTSRETENKVLVEAERLERERQRSAQRARYASQRLHKEQLSRRRWEIYHAAMKLQGSASAREDPAICRKRGSQ